MGARLAGAVLVGLGRLVARLQRHKARPLTSDERNVLVTVFGEALAVDRVRVVPGKAGLFDVNKRPFTLGNTVYLKGRTSPGLLVHEAVHAWQYQHHGPRYAYDALVAQLRLGKGAYDWRAEQARGKAWPQYNAEAQASYVEHLFTEGLPVPGTLFRS